MFYIAQAETGYGCANYGETDAYNSCEVTTSSSDPNLTNTGTFVTSSLVLGVLLLAAAFVLMIRGKKK